MAVDQAVATAGYVARLTAVLLGIYCGLVWLVCVAWTWRDMRLRTRRLAPRLVASLSVALMGVPGLVLYLIVRPPRTLAQRDTRALAEDILLPAIRCRMACPACGVRAEPDFAYCPRCSARLRWSCERCRRPLLMEWASCPYCGQTAPAMSAAAASGSLAVVR